MPWNTPKIWAPFEKLTAADMNKYVSDNTQYLYGELQDVNINNLAGIDTTGADEGDFLVFDGNEWGPGQPEPHPIGNVVFAKQASTVNINSTNYTNTGLSVAITPQSAQSKILIFSSQPFYARKDADDDVSVYARLTRNGTQIAENRYEITLNNAGADRAELWDNISFITFDLPATTAEITYSIQARRNDANAYSVYAGGALIVVEMV